MKVDWLFKNVTVIDGSGGPQYRADVAVKGDRIMAIAPALDVAAEQVIDGQGRVLAPGFIDVHTHDDINVIRMPEYLPKLSQGVTTVIVGNCGISAATATMRGEVPDPMNLLGEQQHFIYPTVEAYAHAVEAARPSLNVGTLIGHTALRNNHMDDLFRPANETEHPMRSGYRSSGKGQFLFQPLPSGNRQRFGIVFQLILYLFQPQFIFHTFLHLIISFHPLTYFCR